MFVFLKLLSFDRLYGLAKKDKPDFLFIKLSRSFSNDYNHQE